MTNLMRDFRFSCQWLWTVSSST